jgi:hypothetical protein
MPRSKSSEEDKPLRQSVNWLATKVRQLEGKLSLVQGLELHNFEDRLTRIEKISCFVDIDALVATAGALAGADPCFTHEPAPCGVESDACPTISIASYDDTEVVYECGWTSTDLEGRSQIEDCAKDPYSPDLGLEALRLQMEIAMSKLQDEVSQMSSRADGVQCQSESLDLDFMVKAINDNTNFKIDGINGCLQDIQCCQNRVDSNVESHAARINAIEASLALLLEPSVAQAAPSSPKKKRAKNWKGSCDTV